jgi:hypothetical protein
MNWAVCFGVFCAVARSSASAATFTVTPNSVGTDYSGVITFQIDGLSPGGSVEIGQFYDFNGNGLVDGPDLQVRTDTLTDGQMKLIGGATNINELHDDDGIVNGSIRSSLQFAFAPALTRGVGKYLFRLSSPAGQFPAITVPFTVVSAAYNQTVQGAVKNNGTNVPFAGVALIQMTGGRSNTKIIAGGTSDAAGNYAMKAPPGAFILVAFHSGYVMDLKSAPSVVLVPNTTVTTNLTLITASTTLAGKMVDADNPGLPAAPLSQITLFSAELLFAVGITDPNSNFNVPVTPGMWTIRPEWQSAITKSYLTPQQGSFMEPSFDVSAGPVTGAAVVLKKATALIYGTVADNHSNSIAGITLSASGDGGAFGAFGVSDANGLYAMGIDAGGGYANVEELSNPPANTYLWSGDSFSIASGESLKLNVTGTIVTAHFRGRVLDGSGSPVGPFSFYANNSLSGGSLTTADTNGNFSLPVSAGNWQLYPDGAEVFQGDYIFPAYSFQITDGVDLVQDIIVQKSTGLISGSIRDPKGAGGSGLYVTFDASIGTTRFKLNTYSDASGAYSIRVFNGDWTVNLSPYDLLNRGYNPANPINLTVPPTNAVAGFNLIPIGSPGDSPQITTTGLPDAFAGQPYYQVLVVTNAARSFEWLVATGALPAGLILDDFLGVISGTPTAVGISGFTIQLNDSRGVTATRALTLDVRSAPPQAPTLDLPSLPSGNVFTVRVTGVAGQTYTLQSTTTLALWTDILSTNAPANVFFIHDDHATNSASLYRVRVGP